MKCALTSRACPYSIRLTNISHHEKVGESLASPWGHAEFETFLTFLAVQCRSCDPLLGRLQGIPSATCWLETNHSKHNLSQRQTSTFLYLETQAMDLSFLGNHARLQERTQQISESHEKELLSLMGLGRVSEPQDQNQGLASLIAKAWLG